MDWQLKGGGNGGVHAAARDEGWELAGIGKRRGGEALGDLAEEQVAIFTHGGGAGGGLAGEIRGGGGAWFSVG